jgi:aspartyl-tRNA(Asn)/glutamyl-tRNA(Gln) amidotransferase subunit C
MSSFSKEDFAHLKRLCRLDCSPEEEEEILSSLQKVLGHVSQLQEVDTSQAPVCTDVHRSMLKNKMREDEVRDCLSRDAFLANAPDQIGGMVRVPPVLKPQ